MEDEMVAEINPDTAPEHEMTMELFTAFHRITGVVKTTSFRTNGVLNHPDTLVMLEKVSTTGLTRSLDTPIESHAARISKQSIIMAVPNEDADNDRLARRSRPSVFMLQKRVLLVLGNFEVSGNLHLEPELELDKVLFNRSEVFIGVTDVSIVYLPNPSQRFTVNTILINRNQVDFICAGAP
jgi:hypothetical protein